MPKPNITQRNGKYAYEFKTRIPLGPCTDAEAEQWDTELTDALYPLTRFGNNDTVACIRRTIARLEAVADLHEHREVHDAQLCLSWDAFVDSPLRSDCDPATLTNYKRHWDAFVDYATYRGCSNVAAITPVVAQGFMAKIKNTGVAAATHKQYLGSVRMIFKVLCPTKTDPWAGVKPLRGEPKRKRPLTAEELGRVLALATGEEYTLFLVAACTGLRFGDCCMFGPEHVDFESATVTICPSKTKRRRPEPVVIPLHPVLRDHLWGLMPDRGRYAPIAAMQYKAGNRYKPNKRVNQILKDLGIRSTERERVGFHSIRYTFITTAAGMDVPLTTIAAIVGHGAVATTKHYIQPDMDAKMDAIMAVKVNLELTAGGEGKLEVVSE